MGNLANLACDIGKENDGVWLQFRGDTRLRIGRMFSVRYDEVWTELLGAAQGTYGDQIPDDLEEKLKVQGAARALLTDWALMDGGLDEDGLPMVVEPIEVAGFNGDAVDGDEYATYDEWNQAIADATPRECGTDRATGKPVTVEEFTGPDGNPYRILAPGEYQQIIPYTPELGMRIFAMDEYRDLYRWVQTQAMRGSLFTAKAKERTAGN